MAGPWQVQIPPDGGAVKASEFGKHADAALKRHKDARGDALGSEEKDQVAALVAAAERLVRDGVVGKGKDEAVYVTLSGNTNDGHTFPAPGGVESIVTLSIYQRQAASGAGVATGATEAPKAAKAQGEPPAEGGNQATGETAAEIADRARAAGSGPVGGETALPPARGKTAAEISREQAANQGSGGPGAIAPFTEQSAAAGRAETDPAEAEKQGVQSAAMGGSPAGVNPPKSAARKSSRRSSRKKASQ